MISYRKRVALLALVGVAVVAALGGRSAPATSTQPGGQTFEVTSTADAVDANPGNGFCAVTTGGCTLRAAIQETNALPGHQTVVLPAGEYVLTRSGNDENVSAIGDLDITGDLTIVGAGTTGTAITQETSDRTIDVREGAVVEISHLTIRHVPGAGGAPCGGGIRNSGDLTVFHVEIRDNVVRGGGGGVCNAGGTLRLSDSLISGNCACLIGPGGGVLNTGGALAILERLVISSNHGDTTGGGGIANYGSMIVRDSLITDNGTGGQASGAGGIANSGSGASLVVINSTISANRADPQGGSPGGGAITNEGKGAVTLVNSTVVGNEASSAAGGIFTRNDGSVTALINAVVANNDSANCPESQFYVPPQSLGHNLDSDGSCGLSGPGDLSGVDPLLGELADNGGPTLTHALLAGSPAIDAGDDAECPAADQRGAPRPSGGACDIGAYEAGAAVPPPAALPGDVDCDGALSPFDELALLRFVGSLAAPDCIGLADLNCDGEAGIVDALVLLRRLAGFIEPPCVPA
jgi:CSLREA domain-containing protein